MGDNLQFSADVPSGSMQAKQKYKDVADAAQAAFESAAQAAAAARAAMELSRSQSQDPDDPSTPKPGSGSANKSQEQKKSEVESKPKQEIEYQNRREEEEAGSKITAEVKNSMPASFSPSREDSEMEEQRAPNVETGLDMETETKPELTEETQKPSFGLNLEKKPMSVRTRRVRGF